MTDDYCCETCKQNKDNDFENCPVFSLHEFPAEGDGFPVNWDRKKDFCSKWEHK